MANFLDVSLLEKFSIIFPFLFAFVVVYGVLSYTKILGGNKAIQSFFAFVVALFTLLSPVARLIINRMAPWFVIFFIFIIFAIMAFKAYGVEDSDLLKIMRSERYGSQIAWFFIVIIIIIALGSITSVTLRGSEKGIRPASINMSEGGGATMDVTKEKSVFWDTLLHPKVLGLAVILLLANFTISKLASGGFPKD